MTSGDFSITIILSVLFISIAAVRISYWIGYWKAQKIKK